MSNLTSRLAASESASSTILAKDRTLSCDTRQTGLNNNALVIGPSGAGKTRNVLKPNLLQMNASYIVLDTKGTLCREVGPVLAAHGYCVQCLNFADLNTVPVLRPTGGAGVTIPEQYGNGGYSVTFYTQRGCYVNGRDTAWAAGTSQAAVHSKWSLAGAKYDDDIATYNGRYLIACTTTYGRVGDKVDFTLSDGTVIKCVIADAKNPNDQGCNKWGHSNGQNVIEFEVDRSRFYRSGNPGSSSWKAEWGGKRVCSSVNSGSIL